MVRLKTQNKDNQRNTHEKIKRPFRYDLFRYACSRLLNTCIPFLFCWSKHIVVRQNTWTQSQNNRQEKSRQYGCKVRDTCQNIDYRKIKEKGSSRKLTRHCKNKQGQNRKCYNGFQHACNCPGNICSFFIIDFFFIAMCKKIEMIMAVLILLPTCKMLKNQTQKKMHCMFHILVPIRSK